MYGAKYAWLIPGWFSKGWWKINLDNESVPCTEDQINKAVEGYIACDNLKTSPENTVTVSGQVIKSDINVSYHYRFFRKFQKFAELSFDCFRKFQEEYFEARLVLSTNIVSSNICVEHYIPPFFSKKITPI